MPLSSLPPTEDSPVTQTGHPNGFDRVRTTGRTGARIIGRLWSFLAYIIGSFALLVIIGITIVGLLAQSLFTGLESGAQATLTEVQVSGSGSDKIVVIPLNGVIGAGGGGGLLSEATGISLEAVDEALTQAERDDAVKAVILSINSPGGSAVVSDEIYERLQDFKETGRSVVAQFGDTAASGGYYIASAADSIVANPATLTGSIGVILEFYNAQGLLDKVGVSPEVVKSGTFKDIASPNRAATPEERQILQSVVDGAYQQFISRIVEGRGLERSKVVSLADGRVYTGVQAKENGLVNELGSRRTAIAVAQRLEGLDEASVVEYGSTGFLDGLLGTMLHRQSSLESAIERLAPSASSPSLQYMMRL